MKNKHIILISSFVLTIILSIASYVLFGERSIFFRTTLVLMLVSIVLNIIYFRDNISQQLKRGKYSRIKLIEAFAVLFFSIALLSLVKSFDLNFDWTARQLFNLSPESKTIISQIKKPLTITVFSYDDNTDSVKGLVDYAEKLGKRYEASNPKKIKFFTTDPIRDKSKAEEYGIRQNGTIVFEMDDRREYVAPNLLVETFSQGEISYKGETIFSAVIDKLNNNKEVNISYLTGHGELDFDSSGIGGYDGIKKMLIDRRYKLSAINLDHYPNISEKTDILIIADPKTLLSPKTYQSIESYIKKGGNILYMVSRNTIADINFLLMKSGFVFLPNVAVDPGRVAQGSGEFSIIPTLSPKSEITLLLKNKKQSVVFPSASVVYSLPEELSDTNEIYDIRPLAKMSQYGFGERSFATGLYTKDDKDIIDIYCLAISSTIANKTDLENQRRSIIFGSTDFIDNARLYTGGNAELFINSIDFLLRKDLKTTIAPKNEDLSQSVPLPEQTRSIVVIVVIWILTWLIVCVVFLLRRKNKVKRQ